MAFSAEEISKAISDARKQFKEQSTNPSTIGQCRACKKWTNDLVQHWNDVGGPDTLECEMCWVESLVVFGFEEDEAAVEAMSIKWDIDPSRLIRKVTDE